MDESDSYFSQRRPWYHKFRNAITNATSVEEIEHLTRHKLAKWLGRELVKYDVDEADPHGFPSEDEKECRSVGNGQVEVEVLGGNISTCLDISPARKQLLASIDSQ